MTDLVGCADEAEINPQAAPIRSRAATRGIECSTARGEVHVFERAPVVAPDASVEPCDTVLDLDAATTTACGSFGQAGQGTEARIADTLGLGQTGPHECAMWVLIADDWFVVSNEEAVLTDLREEVGGVAQPVEPASPPHSYQGPGCTVPN